MKFFVFLITLLTVNVAAAEQYELKKYEITLYLCHYNIVFYRFFAFRFPRYASLKIRGCKGFDGD